MPELGIGTVAQIHLGVAMLNLDFDSNTCGSLYHQSEVIAALLHIEKKNRLSPTPAVQPPAPRWRVIPDR